MQQIRSTLLAFSQPPFGEGMALRLPLHFRRRHEAGMKREDHIMMDWKDQVIGGLRFSAVLSLGFLIGLAAFEQAADRLAVQIGLDRFVSIDHFHDPAQSLELYG